MTGRSRGLPWLGAGLAVVFAAACSSGAAGVALPEPARQGKAIASGAGCQACHGNEGQGGVGPAWAHLAGSNVTLANGTTVVADREYLTRAITEPRAQVATGFTVAMPTNSLSPDQVARVVDYIEALR